MAISAISSRYAGFTFDGESSKTYGVYITDGGFYSAPIRDTEVVEIPGRNGAYILDRGRFKNIQVTYKAFMGAERKEDFISGISAVRNWLCSKKGYVRLTDDFNPDEYRLATFSNGLEVSNINPKIGEFDITFECMPQRFLTSGETAQTITSSGDSITNPTLFNSRPMLEVEGYGKIGINEDEVEIISGPIGRVPLIIGRTYTQPAGLTANFSLNVNSGLLNSGDGIQCLGFTLTVDLGVNIGALESFTQSGNIIQGASGLNTSAVKFNFYGFSFAKGVARTASASVTAGYYVGGGVQYQTISVSVDISTAAVITIGANAPLGADGFQLAVGTVFGNSSKSALGDPVYIDLDIGEAYKIEGGELVSVNSAVSLGADLPELNPGANEITFENTITSLKVIPRWWKV